MDTLPLVNGLLYDVTDDDADKPQTQYGFVFPKQHNYTETSTVSYYERSWTWVGG